MKKVFDLQQPVMGLSNRVKAQVIENGRVVFETPWAANLILDQGMDRFAIDNLVNLFTHCAVGTGNTPTEDDSGVITVTTSGTTATASAPIFAAGDVGKLLRCVTGEKAKITGFTSTTVVTLASALGVAVGQVFKMYRVTQTGLTSESRRSNTYLTGSGNCGSTLAGSALTHRRTYDFPVEVANVNYAEVGFSHTATVAANLNTRALFSGGAVTVLIGQQIRVVYDFVITLSPTSPRTKKFPITGWPSLQQNVTADSTTDKITLTAHGFPADTEIVFGGTSAPGGLTFGTSYYVVVDAANTFKVAASPGGGAIDITTNGSGVYVKTNTLGTEQLPQVGIMCITTAGGQTQFGTDSPGGVANTGCEPSATGFIFFGTDSTAHVAFPIGISATWAGTVVSKSLVLDTYVAGSFTRTKSVSLTAGEGNSSAIRTIAITNSGSTVGKGGIRFLFNHPQEKTSLFTLSCRFRYTWDRDFS
jgi:hypothetical protein